MTIDSTDLAPMSCRAGMGRAGMCRAGCVHRVEDLVLVSGSAVDYEYRWADGRKAEDDGATTWTKVGEP
jgi:hypothetical protein